jgi:hypothetical protein
MFFESVMFGMEVDVMEDDEGSDENAESFLVCGGFNDQDSNSFFNSFS